MIGRDFMVLGGSTIGFYLSIDAVANCVDTVGMTEWVTVWV